MKKKCLVFMGLMLISCMLLPTHAKPRPECRLSVAEWGVIFTMIRMDFDLVKASGNSLFFPGSKDIPNDAKKMMTEIIRVDGVGGRVSSMAALLIGVGIRAGAEFEDLPECRDVRGSDLSEKIGMAEKCSDRLHDGAFAELSKKEIPRSMQRKDEERLRVCGWR